MEGFTKIDIFDTKGAEYIFVIGYLLLLIIFWNVSARQAKLKKRLKKVFAPLSAGQLRIPQGILYSPNHTWAHMEKSGIAKVGIDDLLQHITGEVLFTGLKQKGDFFQKGDLLAEMKQDGKSLQVFSPVSGQVLDTNPSLAESPEIVNEEPFENGWIYKIRPVNWKEDTKSCYLAEGATEWSVKELQRFKDFLAESVKKYSPEPSFVILQDGGEILDNTLSRLPSEVWLDFQKEFLGNDLLENQI